jgi:hypothetical protein
MNRQYQSFFNILYVYWKIYGGWRAMFGSPYLQISALVALLSYSLWWKCSDWTGIALSAIPNILGFSIGAFAVILSFGQGALDRLKDKNEAQSRYLSVIASFVHFILIQAASLIVAMIGKTWTNSFIGFLGTTLCAYAILLAVAASFRLFRLARVYNQVKESGNDENQAGD